MHQQWIFGCQMKTTAIEKRNDWSSSGRRPNARIIALALWDYILSELNENKNFFQHHLRPKKRHEMNNRKKQQKRQRKMIYLHCGDMKIGCVKALTALNGRENHYTVEHIFCSLSWLSLVRVRTSTVDKKI